MNGGLNGLNSWKSLKNNKASTSHVVGYTSRKLVKKPTLPQSHRTTMTRSRDRYSRDWLLLEQQNADTNNGASTTRNQSNGKHHGSHDQQKRVMVSRSMSSSTLDSDECFSYLKMNNDSFDNEDDIELVEHIVLPSDTLQGICIQYKISATKLRQVNIFSGTSVKLAPKRLLIPVPISKLKVVNASSDSGDSFSSGSIRLQDRTTKEYKVHKLLCECPTLRIREIEAYLSLHNDDLEKAMTVALADLEWEKTQGCKETIDYSPPLSLHKFVDTTVALQMHNNRTDDGCSHGNTSERKRKHLIELQPVVNSSTCADNWEDISVPKSYKSVQDLTLQASGKDQLESRPIPKLIFSIPSSTGLRKRRSLSEQNEFGIELKEITTQA